MRPSARPTSSASSTDRGWLRIAGGLIALVLLLGGPILLHFRQIAHNELPPLETRLPEGKPFVPGMAFAATAKALIEHELDSVTGWRPNDFVLWGPDLWADNNAHRQFGIIQTLRESVRVAKDHLTKISSDEFDENLVAADTAFRNDETKFWLPSAESAFRKGARHLKRYLDGLQKDPPTSRPINQRNVELIRLFQAWTDLLGGAHGRLYSDKVSWMKIDDAFYEAQGFAHVMHHLTLAVQKDYGEAIASREVLKTLFEETIAALGKAATMKPLVVVNGSPSGLFANHRRNLAVYIGEARQRMYSLREELEK